VQPDNQELLGLSREVDQQLSTLRESL